MRGYVPPIHNIKNKIESGNPTEGEKEMANELIETCLSLNDNVRASVFYLEDVYGIDISQDVAEDKYIDTLLVKIKESGKYKEEHKEELKKHLVQIDSLVKVYRRDNTIKDMISQRENELEDIERSGWYEREWLYSVSLEGRKIIPSLLKAVDSICCELQGDIGVTSALMLKAAKMFEIQLGATKAEQEAIILACISSIIGGIYDAVTFDGSELLKNLDSSLTPKISYYSKTNKYRMQCGYSDNVTWYDGETLQQID